MASFRQRIESDELLFDNAIVGHGFAPHLRDYDVVVEVIGPGEGGLGQVVGRYRYRFTHCVDVKATTAVRDDVWRESWDEVFVDHQAWLDADAPPDSALAAEWRQRLGRDMHEVEIETNAFVLRLVCHDLRVEQLSM
jgi:hypothetical protein